MLATRRDDGSRPAADRLGDIEMAKGTKKNPLLGQDRAGGTGAGAVPDFGSPTSATRPSTTGGASSPPPKGLSRGGIITIIMMWVFAIGVCCLALYYVFREDEIVILDESKLTGTWNGLHGVYVIDGTEVKKKTSSGSGPIAHLKYGIRLRRFFTVYWNDIEGDKEAGKKNKSSTVASFGEDKAKNEVNYISWSTYSKGPYRHDVWIRDGKTEAAVEDMRTALDGTWIAEKDSKWTEAKVVRKGNEQVWLMEGMPDSPIKWSADGKLFERRLADGGSLTWDGYVHTDPSEDQFMVWALPEPLPGRVPLQWQKAYGVPIDIEKLKGTWIVKPAAGGAGNKLKEDHCYDKVSTSWFSNSVTWKHDNVAFTADTMETLPQGVRRITWTAEGKDAMIWQNKVFD